VVDHGRGISGRSGGDGDASRWPVRCLNTALPDRLTQMGYWQCWRKSHRKFLLNLPQGTRAGSHNAAAPSNHAWQATTLARLSGFSWRSPIRLSGAITTIKRSIYRTAGSLRAGVGGECLLGDGRHRMFAEPSRCHASTKALRYRGGRIFLVGPNECAGAAVASEVKEHITRRR
jgi:hypothetical protein